MLRITDKAFHYTPSFNTDLAKKFRKMARDMRAESEAKTQAVKLPATGSVVPLARRVLPRG